MNTLTFQSTTFDVIDRNGQPWLKASEIANAIGYSRADKITRLYDRNADEFTEDMTAIIENPTLGVSGNLTTKTRIFSPRGCYALGMFARTKIAKDFRVWVLDVLEGKTKTAPAIGYTRISPAQAQTLKEHVQRVVEAGLQTFGETWGRLHKKFRVNSYLELSTGQFEEACRYLEQKLPRQYHFPLNTADPHDRQFANANLAPSVLLDPKNRAPELELIAQLEKDGYDVMGAKMRIFAMRDAMEYLENYRNNMAHMYEKLKPLVDICKNGMRENGKNVKFVGKVNPANAIDRLVFGDQM